MTHTSIVGGGVAGLVAARVLGRHGHQVTIIEPRERWDEGGAGLVLWPSALRALRELGFPAPTDGAPLRESILRDAGGRTLLRIPLALSRRALPRVMTRQALMRLLGDGDHTTILRKACVDVSDTGPHPVVTLSDGTKLQADYAIIASGMRSGNARACGRMSWRGVAPLSHPRLAAGTAIETLGRGCRVGLFPAGDGLTYWYVQLNLHGDVPTWDALVNKLAGWPDPIPDVLAATPRDGIVETAISEMRPQPRWLRKNVLVIGDAAHGMTPDLGRGACTAILNLRQLDRQLAATTSFEAAATGYVKARRRRTLLIQRASRVAGTIRQIESPLLFFLRNLAWRYFPPLLLFRLLIAPLLIKRLG